MSRKVGELRRTRKEWENLFHSMLQWDKRHEIYDKENLEYHDQYGPKDYLYDDWYIVHDTTRTANNGKRIGELYIYSIGFARLNGKIYENINDICEFPLLWYEIDDPDDPCISCKILVDKALGCLMHKHPGWITDY